MSYTLGRPLEQAHRVALGLQQAFQIGQQTRIMLHRWLAVLQKRWEKHNGREVFISSWA